MHHFRIEADRSSGHTGHVDAVHKWVLPGILNCPGCKTTWGSGSKTYPSVDLTPVLSLADFEEARAQPIEEYERLSELVRPLLPPGCVLEPGAGLGPLVGNARGSFGSLVSPDPWWLLVQREALEKLQAKGIQGLKGCPTELRFRQRNSPELLELEIRPVGRAHPDCLPPTRNPPCSRCHRLGLSVPDELLLEARTLPSDRDLFRLEDFSGVIVCTERFVDACERLELDGVTFKPLPSK